MDDLLAGYRRRTRELEALYETAGDLSALRDVDQVLAAIVRRGRQLLASDMAYLMLLDKEAPEAYMRVTDGTLTPEFLSIRLSFGQGLGGLVAGTGMPQWTSDYPADPRFASSLDRIIRDEGIKAILGVPLKSGDRVIGVLFASARSRREFEPGEVALLGSLASHAAIALENASLFEESQRALAELQQATARIEEHSRQLEVAAELHEKLTQLVLTGAPLPALADAVADSVGGAVVVLDPDGHALTPVPDAVSTAVDGPTELLAQLVTDLAEGADRSGHRGGSWATGLDATAGPTTTGLSTTAAAPRSARIAPVGAGGRGLGFLVHLGEPLGDTDVRSLERAALVTALLLLDRRALDEAGVRAREELLGDLVGAARSPGSRETPQDVEARVRERARAGGIALAQPPYVALVAVDADPTTTGPAGGTQAARHLADEVARVCSQEQGLAHVRDGHAAFLLHGSDASTLARDLARRLTEAGAETVTVGAEGPSELLAEAAARLPRALTCARVLQAIGQHGSGATPEQLGIYTLLLSETGQGQIEGFVRETLGPVLDDDAAREGGRLVDTLTTWYDLGGQPKQVAESLFVHVNTLYQRLERVDRLLGREWRRGEQSLQVHLALRLARLLRDA